MTFPLISIGLTAVFVVVLLYLLVIKKDLKTFKSVLYPGLFFIGVWILIYYALLH
ncbi:MAG TPA: hypothetical protein PLP62_05440 [Flavobacteriaceae bacterium]|nr:hypothetical protein [Flavobacteriaceae bacterium]MCB9213799.1 hypothetical protein [Alteromonas sp.]HPF10874.1 hypothetical protein [Flavobacteriaceae bacterium]HQU66553.1 hypothetical protein [Flavobacteriaceae bacterium]HRW44469.1 hypothetical protein [Flavobacteriaceae bacterium]